jgi:hydrogenase maturation protein HypF
VTCKRSMFVHERHCDVQGSTQTTYRWIITGHVQGVGFRPYVYRLAHQYKLTGWVRNQLGQVEIVAQGTPQALQTFSTVLISNAPLIAKPVIQVTDSIDHDPLRGFEIRVSRDQVTPEIHVPPDYFLCAECRAELNNSANRRYRYPFINCTQCGPRYTLIKALPYDRPNTSMADFEMCRPCREEYQDPMNRRFHAEPIACPTCGPQLGFDTSSGKPVSSTQASLIACRHALKAGRIVAVKGIGGYHLLCDAKNDLAITRLRTRKPRPAKPLAVLFPERGVQGLDEVLREVKLDDHEARLLLSPQRPIVLAPKRLPDTLSQLVAPGLAEIGVMLPYSPLHHLLLNDFGGPLVATSANISGEPVLTDNEEAENRLARVAEGFLHHDRAIVRPADDSVFRHIHKAARPLRLGRGHAPIELSLPFSLPQPVLAVGGHMKNTVALAWGTRAVISPHIGELNALRSQRVFEQMIAELQTLYRVRAERVICDAHPGYASTRWAQRCGMKVEPVYHHPAHASALAGEYALDEDWLVFTWDGAGLGEDGALWGGEALAGRPGKWQRVASLRPFYLAGGDKAAREPWRCAVALCWEAGKVWSSCPRETTLLYHAWRRRLNCPQTSAVGRLFDGAAALTGLLQEASFEGQGPMLLEAASKPLTDGATLPVIRNEVGLWMADWQPLLDLLMDESLSVTDRGSAFHGAMARVIRDQARIIRAERGITLVGLCGGVFQNRLLSELAVKLLQCEGFKVRLTQRLPCNDGGLSFGQIVEYGARSLSDLGDCSDGKPV